jgi:DNA-binding CsgD family transcriptional regulator/PAS domain-containing protein
MASIDIENLSETIGKIYDSAVDPALWPAALESCCGLIGATLGSIALYDLRQKTTRWGIQWGGDPHWMRLLEEKYAALMPFWPALDHEDVGSIKNTAHMVKALGGDEEEIRKRPFFTEWAVPAGYHDVAACIIARSETRRGIFQLHTPPTRDVVGPHDIAVVNLLFPHVRRAVSIGDLLDMRSIASATFEATLDSLVVAVILVDMNGRILHANANAQRMFGAGGPVLSTRGELNTHQPGATAALKTAIARAAANESELGHGGIGVPIRARDDGPQAHSIAHVLPLKSGALRSGLGLGAAAAVFVTPPGEHTPPPFEALAALYDLTPTEARVMIEIASGKNRADTAATLGIADSTVKTHLARVFEKTRTSDQAELARLVASLTPPVAGG